MIKDFFPCANFAANTIAITGLEMAHTFFNFLILFLQTKKLLFLQRQVLSASRSVNSILNCHTFSRKYLGYCAAETIKASVPLDSIFCLSSHPTLSKHPKLNFKLSWPSLQPHLQTIHHSTTTAIHQSHALWSSTPFIFLLPACHPPNRDQSQLLLLLH